VMARDYAHLGIRVNAAIPGFTDAPFVKRAMARDATKERILARVPMGRPGSPEEVAPMIAYLASVTPHIRPEGPCLLTAAPMPTEVGDRE